MSRAKAPEGMVKIIQSPTNGTKLTTAETDSGKTYTFTGDNWVDYANKNNLDVGSLKTAITYPSYVTANEANRYLNENAANATAKAKAENPNNPGIQGTTFGAGIYDKVGKGDLINEYNRLNPNNQLNPSDYGVKANDYGTQYNRVDLNSVPNAGGYNAGGYNSSNYNATFGVSPNSYGLPSFQKLSFDELYDMYSGATAKQVSGAEAIMDSLMKKYGLYEDEINSDYDKANKDAYINMMMAKKDLPQQMAANGLTGGLTESSLLGLRSDYGNTYAENERGRVSAINDIRTSAQESAADIANTIAGYEAQAMNNATNAFVNMINAENAFNQWVYEAETARTERERNAALQNAQVAYEKLQDDTAKRDAFAKELIDVALKTENEALLNEALTLMGSNLGLDGVISNAFGVGDGKIDLGGGGPHFTPTPVETVFNSVDSDNLLGASNVVRGMIDNERSVDEMKQYLLNRVNNGTLTPSEATQIAINYGFEV